MIATELPIRIGRGLNERGHWATKHRRAQAEKLAGRLAVQATDAWRAKAIPLPAVVTLTRIAPRALDDDNLAGGFKAVRDGVALALGVDDADPRVRWRYAQERGQPKHYAARITIEAA